MEENLEYVKKLSMFYPSTKKGILLDYPELAKRDSFRTLSRSEILFVWYYACKSSPFNKEEDDKIKIEASLVQAFGKKAKAVRSTYMAGNMGEKVKTAITEMRTFEIGPRIRAKLMVEKIMSNYEKLVDVNLEEDFKNKDGEIDWTKKKAYIDASSTISKTLPALIGQSEGGFGISEKEDGDILEISSADLIETFHKNN
jgi:hypothetical protein